MISRVGELVFTLRLFNMSRITKWKIEKAKVKVVFRLQFHATHIPQTGWNNLFISLFPADSGKATAKTNKTSVRNGTCKWSDPIYETTRLLQDTKTKQYEEKFYKLLVAMGTSRSSILGEASINLSDYVDALKPTVVALPLQGSDDGAILNVTVQLLTSKTGFREFEQQREVSDRGLQTNPDHDSGKLSTPGDAVVSRTDKVNPRVRFKPQPKELPSLEEESGFSEEYADSAAGFDGSSNTSDSLCAEKHDNSSSREIDSVKGTVSGDPRGISPSQSPTTKRAPSDHPFLVQGNTDWVNCWGAENTVDSEIAIVHEENSQLRRALEAADLSIHELRQEIISLQRHADDIAVETQTLTQQLTVEITSEKELAKEVSLLKSECLRIKGDLEWLRNIKMNPLIPRMKTTDSDQCSLLQDLNMRWVKGLSVVEDKIIEVQNKVQLGLHGKDSIFLHSDLEALLSVLRDLKRETVDEIPAGKENLKTSEMGSAKADVIMSDTGLGVELCHPEGVLLPGLLAHGTTSVDATNAMQVEIFKLLRELDETKAERETLVRKMDQMECYYEALIQELEENQKQVLGELQNLRNEHSSCIYTISSTKAQMEAMHQQMNDELLQLTAERCNLDALNKELERRAVSSEGALRRARLNYSIAVNQLQKDLEVLSLQVVSMYETNENLIRKAFEASQPLLRELDDSQDSYTDKLTPLQNHNTGLKNQLLGGDRFLEDLRRSLKLQEELYEKIQEEVSEMHLANVHLDVFSMMLHHALLEAASDSRLVEKEMHEFAKQLEISFKSNESLKLKLQNIMNEKLALSEEKNITVSRCNDLASRNLALEANLREKIGELESLVTECRSYKSKYEDCNADKAKLENLLEEAAAEKGHLSDEMSSLQEELRTLKSKVSELSSSKESLQKMFDSFQIRLEKILASGNEQVDGLASSGNSKDTIKESEELASMMSCLEDLHHNFHCRILQLMKDKEDLLHERDVAKSEVDIVMQKFQSDVPDMVGKINASSALVEKLQTDLETVGNRLKVSSEAEEKYARMREELFTDFAKMEAALQELTSKNRDLAEEMMALGSVTGELEGNKLTIDEITQENFNLMASLQNKTDETDKLAFDLSNLRGTVRSLQDELVLEREIRERLEVEVLNLNAQVVEADDKVSHLDQQKGELCLLKKQLSDMESEKLSNLDIQLCDIHALFIAADVKNTVVLNQYRCLAEVLVQQLEYSDQQLKVAEKKYSASKANYAEEIARLLSELECLKSESESCFSLNKALEHSNSVIASELEDCKKKSDVFKSKYSKAEIEYKFEIEDLILSKEDLEIRLLVLKAKLEEINAQINLQGEYKEELVKKLQKQCSELSRKLSEQILKTEEFKNLSIHLKELKDKADAENLKSHEKRESEGSSVAMQESLRIAFIKEQYETKLQEVRHQLSVSKKHGEEMLWKLQGALDEIENRKRCEESLLKSNEELLLKIAELEVELQSALSDNRERLMAYDQLKAELECSVMSLDCCKEEKNQIMASLQECNDEKSRLADEVEMMREQLENLKAFMRNPENKGTSHIAQTIPSTSCCVRRASDAVAFSNSSAGQAEDRNVDMVIEGEMNQQPLQGASVANSAEGIPDFSNGQREILQDDKRHAALLNDQLKAQKLLSSMDRLHKELEKMRSENMLLPGDENAVESDSEEGLQIDQAHLEKVTEELGNMSSLYSDSSRSGNSVERVLALELELAETLQAKKKSSIQFQSSFLKLHSDEAAVFQSFRDINELIKDMLEMKGRYGAMEAELKEMHERYSQLSLQFAEVEGERQKLMMTLKNARSSKRLFTRSPSSSPVESSS